MLRDGPAGLLSMRQQNDRESDLAWHTWAPRPLAPRRSACLNPPVHRGSVHVVASRLNLSQERVLTKTDKRDVFLAPDRADVLERPRPAQFAKEERGGKARSEPVGDFDVTPELVVDPGIGRFRSDEAKSTMTHDVPRSSSTRERYVRDL